MTSDISSINFENSEFQVGESSTKTSSVSFHENKSVGSNISNSDTIPLLNLKNCKLRKIVSSVNYNKKLPNHDEFLKLNRLHDQENNRFLNTIKHL